MGFLAFASSWRVAGPLFAAASLVGWAVGTSLTAIYTFRQEPELVDTVVIRAATYRAAMREWLAGGRGFPVGKTVVEHIRELAIYLILALVSANLLGLFMGAVLLNFMNAWVASALGVARRQGTVVTLAWPIWSIVRVLSYIALGVAAAGPLAALGGYPGDPGQLRWLWIVGGSGVVLDLILKLTLSSRVGRALAAATEFKGETCDAEV